MPKTFDFIYVDGRPVFLKVTGGCYVRVSDISVVGTGITSALDGGTVAPPVTVAVHMRNGSYAAFTPCENEEDALARADDLATAIAKAEKK